GGPADVTEAVAARVRADVEVVLEHEALRLRGGGLGLVAVRALREGGGAGGLLPPARLLGGRRARSAGRGRGEPPTCAGGAEGGAVRRLAGLAEDLVDVLVRDLVLQDLEDGAPRLLEDERARDLERARLVEPPPEVRARRDEGDLRGDEGPLEIRAVYMRV